MIGRSLTERVVAGVAFLATVSVLAYLTATGRPARPERTCPPHLQTGLRVAAGDDISASTYRRELFDEWNARHRPRVTLIEVGETTDDERKEMISAAQAGRCAYDVLIMDVAWVPEFARNGFLQETPLTEEQRAAFVPQALRTGEVDGTQYAVPFGTNIPVLYYKSDLPYPRDLDEFLSLARRHGYAAQLDDYEGGTVNLLEAMLSGGARLMDGDRVVLDEPGDAARAEEALRRWSEMTRALLERRPGHANLQERTSMREFRRADIGYLRNWAFSFHELAADPALHTAGGALRFEVGRFPTRGVLGGFNLAIAKDSPHAEEAMELIRFLTGKEHQSRLFACGGYPPVLRAVYDEFRTRPTACEKRSEEDPRGAIGPEDLRTLAAAVHAGLQNTVTRPASPSYPVFSEVFRACVRDAVLEGPDAPPINYPAFAAALRDALDGRPADRNACAGSA
ncbi:extracellular solute-binding protein [Nonomuraea candida]|uniref:extracellular solute-binding protein n=1 Tax=Nonomuraea candida TaxID=359159 RepID=UPI0005B7D14B|nr:extracellular solute-binding protein [Nonomuraea candida]